MSAPAAPSAPKLEAVVYRRGETNINKRFIETKFAGFFKAVLGPAEKEMWVVWVTATGGEHWSKRIVSIILGRIALADKNWPKVSKE